MRCGELNLLFLLFLGSGREQFLLDLGQFFKRLVFEDYVDEVEDRVGNTRVLHRSDLGYEGLDSCDVAVDFALEPAKKRFSLTANLEGTATVHGYFLLNAIYLLRFLEKL